MFDASTELKAGNFHGLDRRGGEREIEGERERESACISSALLSQHCAAALPDVPGYQVRAEMPEWLLR